MNRGGAAEKEVVLGKRGLGKEDPVGQGVDHQVRQTQGQGVDHQAGQTQGPGVAAEVSLLTRKAVCGAVQNHTSENFALSLHSARQSAKFATYITGHSGVIRKEVKI